MKNAIRIIQRSRGAALLAAAALLLAGPARAELLVYEPFDYDDAPLNGQGGALGTTGTWMSFDTGFKPAEHPSTGTWWVHPEGELTGQATSNSPLPTGTLNTFDGTLDNLATAGGFAGSAGPEEQGSVFGTRDPTGNMDANIALDPSVTETFVAGNTTWFSYVGVRADDRNEGTPTLMICTDPTVNGSRSLTMQNSGNGIGGGGGPPRFNLLEVYPTFFRDGLKNHTPGGWDYTEAESTACQVDTSLRGLGTYGLGDGIVECFGSGNNTTARDQLYRFDLGTRPNSLRFAEINVNDPADPGDDTAGQAGIIVGKIEWDADADGEDILSVVQFFETDELTEANFDAIIASKPSLSSANWASNKPDFDTTTQSEFDTINISSLKFWVDEIRIATTFEDVTPAPVPPPTIALTITVNPGGGYDLEWDSTTSLLYNIRSSTDLVGLGSGWPIVLPDIPGEAGTTTRTVTPGDPARYYLVEGFPPPPVELLSENFEGGDGNFSTTTTVGTAWEFGSPQSEGPGGGVTQGNTDSTLACWGTGLGPADMGQYVDSTITCLRSTVIDLTGFAEAELLFAEALDLEQDGTTPDDVAVVNIIDDTTDTVIEAAIYTATDGSNSDASWNSTGPIAIPLGSLPVDGLIRIEWCLTGFGGTTNDYLGWYIDDVLVTGSGP